MAESPASARERIMETSLRLFYQNGIRATGIDRIIAESGVAKMSFYRNFPSKKDLVAEFLKRRHEFWMNWFSGRVGELRAEGATGLTVLTDALEEWFREPTFRGCAFINIVAEPGEESERVLAQEHKESLRQFILGLLPATDASRAGEYADLALLIVEGAIVRAQMTGDPKAAAQARRLLGMLDTEWAKNS